jgi:hypothetical protein
VKVKELQIILPTSKLFHAIYLLALPHIVRPCPASYIPLSSSTRTPKAPALPLPKEPRRRYQTPAGTHGKMQRYQTMKRCASDDEKQEKDQIYRLGTPPKPMPPVIRPPPALRLWRTMASAACAAARRSYKHVSVRLVCNMYLGNSPFACFDPSDISPPLAASSISSRSCRRWAPLVLPFASLPSLSSWYPNSWTA